MQVLKNPDRSLWNDLVKRPSDHSAEMLDAVKSLLADVKANGDAAVKKYSVQFDKYEKDAFKVSAEELESAASKLPVDLIKAIDTAVSNIAKFHKSQELQPLAVETVPGVKCWRKAVPIESVGFYIPGGTAPLFSSALMLGVPAKIAGCKNIVVCTPPAISDECTINPVIAYCCNLLGIKNVFAVGGAQAIAAMAYGTATVPKVSKIFGPGNRYVTFAKEIVSQNGVAIDIPAGPSEVLIIADESADPEFVAADLLSQAEHGEDSQVILLTNTQEVLDQVLSALDGQITRLDRQVTARCSLEKSRAIVFEKLQDAVDFSNLYAPEHLIIATKAPHSVSDYVINAGSVFLGNYSPESAGDYASGTNHTLPTSGSAVVSSGVSLDSFVKKITFQEISKDGLQRIAPAILAMAEAEGLEAHKESVSIRFK